MFFAPIFQERTTSWRAHRFSPSAHVESRSISERRYCCMRGPDSPRRIDRRSSAEISSTWPTVPYACSASRHGTNQESRSSIALGKSRPEGGRSGGQSTSRVLYLHDVLHDERLVALDGQARALHLHQRAQHVEQLGHLAGVVYVKACTGPCSLSPSQVICRSYEYIALQFECFKYIYPYALAAGMSTSTYRRRY